MEPPAGDAHRSSGLPSATSDAHRSNGQVASSHSASRGQDDDASSVVSRCSSQAIDAVTGLPLSRAQLRQQLEAKDCALKAALARNEAFEKQVCVARLVCT